MTPQTHYQTRLNLIDLVTETIRDAYAGSPDEPLMQPMFRLLRIYRADTVRLMEGKPGTLEYLWLELKVGIRLGGAIMDEVQKDESQSLIGWYHGCPPRNMVQGFYNLLSATVLELAKSILEIEEQYPGLAPLFALERKGYATLCDALENKHWAA